MARSSATRVGNGAGWGGSAKGAGNRKAGPGRGHTHRTVADLMIAAGCRQIAAERWQAILDNPAHPKHAEMVAKAADRMDGAPSQDVTSKGERIGYVIPAPAEAEDATAWAEQHKPR